SKVAILTDYGLSVYKLLKNNVIKLFGQQVEITMIEKADFNEEDLDDYEIVISTVKENRLFNRIIYIEDAFDEQVLKLKVEQFLIYKDLNRKNIFNKSVIADCMTENDLYYVDNNYTYQEMIAVMADALYEQNKV
ncbi:transcriptional antiterminator, partial [Staphylococcus succinus]